MSQPLTYHIDNPSVRNFQVFTGEKLENLDPIELWDIHIVLSQAVLLANVKESVVIDIHNAIEESGEIITDKVAKCLLALNGFPVSQVTKLLSGIMEVADDKLKHL